MNKSSRRSEGYESNWNGTGPCYARLRDRKRLSAVTHKCAQEILMLIRRIADRWPASQVFTANMVKTSTCQVGAEGS